MSTALVRWQPQEALLRPPLSGDPELTTGHVAAILKVAPRTASKRLDAGLIAGVTRDPNSAAADAQGDRRLPLSAIIAHLTGKKASLTNLFAWLATVSATKRPEMQAGVREILPPGVIVVSPTPELADMVASFVAAKSVDLKVGYHATLADLNRATDPFLPLFYIADSALGDEVIGIIELTAHARSEQFGCPVQVVVIALGDAQPHPQNGALVFRVAKATDLPDELPRVIVLPADGAKALAAPPVATGT